MTLSADERAAIEARLREDDDWLRQEIAAGSNAMVFGRTYMEQRHADRRALRAALVAAEARAKALAEAADRFGQFLEHELVMYSDEDSPGSLIDTPMRHRFDDEEERFHAALAAYREPAG